jgi:phosphatidylserine/phosphatidylglycerophosphate/cardiolipin synthase-like enzyme
VASVRFASLVLAFVLGAGLATPLAARQARAAPALDAAFTPGDDVSGLIARRIAKARATVQVQAYLFTDRKLAQALLAALKRGVEVEIVGDAAQQEAGGLPWLGALQRAGARVFLDASHAAAHNKIVIVDGASDAATVITGSYNFTQAAQSKNAENVVVIWANRAVTDRFLANFEYHRAESTPWP